MPLIPSLKPMFDAQHNAPPMPPAMDIAQTRDAMHAMIEQSYFVFSSPREPVAIERDFAIPVEGGEIVLRLYRADAGDAVLPVHIYFHGGGFFLGTLDQGDGGCRALAKDLGSAIISVDYRLAPEHPFPTAAEDAYAALLWVAAHAETLRIDPAFISVGGGSAGGNLAAVVALMARDRNGPPIVAQVLEIPVTDFTSSRTLEFPDEGIHIASAKAYAPIYLRREADASNPLASPLLAASLSDLPPALVLCAQYDQLQPEGEAYAARLTEAGVPTIYRCWAGQFHGSQRFDTLIPEESAAYHAEIIDFLRKSYSSERVTAA